MHGLSDKLAVAAIEHATLPVKSILVLEPFSLTLLKINKVMIREFPEGGCLRFLHFVDLELITALHSPTL